MNKKNLTSFPKCELVYRVCNNKDNWSDLNSLIQGWYKKEKILEIFKRKYLLTKEQEEEFLSYLSVEDE